MSKYDPLRDYLANLPSGITEKTMLFEELEHILGFRLPQSAHIYIEWWSNPKTPIQHPYAQSWLAAGWKVETANQTQKWVRFIRY